MTCLVQPRVYPRSFADKLLELYEKHAHEPRYDLRCKRPVDRSLSDRQLFNQMKDTDLWLDAGLPEVLAYCWSSKYLVVPDSWQSCMTEYVQSVCEQVIWLHYSNIWHLWNMLENLCDMHLGLNPNTTWAEVIPNAWFHQSRCTVPNLLAAGTEPLTGEKNRTLFGFSVDGWKWEPAKRAQFPAKRAQISANERKFKKC